MGDPPREKQDRGGGCKISRSLSLNRYLLISIFLDSFTPSWLI
jgi:hypothetical protein